MQGLLTNKLKQVRLGLIFALMTLLFGYGMGVFFGGWETSIKTYLDTEARTVFTEKYNNDEAKLKKVTKKSWSYIKRAHFHGNGIATTALVLIGLLALCDLPVLLRQISAFFMGFGGFSYSIFWLWAGLKAPGLGSTGGAKEALTWLGAPSASMVFLGVLMAIILIISHVVKKEKA